MSYKSYHLWDLSAAFDCLDPIILCQKLKLYGFSDVAIKWYKSFLTDRTQRVKIGDSISERKDLKSGVPQGGILSPLVFVLYVSDLSKWLKFSIAGTYADDTQSSVTGKDLSVVKKELEFDAVQVLRFMASNGLIANPKKTAFVILNQKPEPVDMCEILIGKEIIVQEKSAKLLGVTFEWNQKWSEHIYGSGGLLSSLNQRLFFIRRLKNHVGLPTLLKISDSLFTSKIRYGLQLLGSVRWLESDPINQDFQAIQKCQNKLLRVLNGTKFSD